MGVYQCKYSFCECNNFVSACGQTHTHMHPPPPTPPPKSRKTRCYNQGLTLHGNLPLLLHSAEFGLQVRQTKFLLLQLLLLRLQLRGQCCHLVLKLLLGYAIVLQHRQVVSLQHKWAAYSGPLECKVVFRFCSCCWVHCAWQKNGSQRGVFIQSKNVTQN